MAKRKWTETSALDYLSDKNILITRRNIPVLDRYNGLTTLSAADYLKNVHKYRLVRFIK
jgi:hypothetical protein